MIIFILITIFAIYYIAMIASLFKSEGFSIIGLILDVVIMGTLIFYYFIGARFVDHDLSNFLMFMDTGSYIFMYFAIKCLWVKPKVVNYLIAKELGESKEVIEEQELDLQADAISMNPVFIFVGVIIILIWLVLDIYRKKKYGIFLFKTIVPLVVTTWIIIATIILS